MSESSTVLYSTEKEIAVLLLNRPEKRNAISIELLSTLHTAILKATKEESVRALVLGGIGPSFCAGADLKERATMSPKEVKRFLKDLKKLFFRTGKFSISDRSGIGWRCVRRRIGTRTLLRLYPS